VANLHAKFEVSSFNCSRHWLKLEVIPKKVVLGQIGDRNILDVHQKQYVTASPGIYLGGKFGEHRWKIAICRAFNSFCVTDSLTHSLTNRHTNWRHNLSNAADALVR